MFMNKSGVHNYKSLTKVLMKGESMETSSSKKKRILVGILGIFAVLFVIIPACVLVAVMSYVMTSAVVAAGGNEQGLAMILMFIASFSVIFGISVILNVFYFSNDMKFLLALPLEPASVIASKFTVAYINESIMEFLIIVSAMVGYMIATQFSVAGVVITLFAMITIPVLPLVYCGIISIAAMTFTKFIRNKDSVRRFTGIATIVFVLIILAGADLVGGVDVENYATSFVQGSNGLYNTLSVVFVHVKWICEGMNGDWLALIYYLIINIIFIALFITIAQKFYYKGVVNLSASGQTGVKSDNEFIRKKTVKKSVVWTYISKEFKIIIRTPAFFMNCILINFIWPVLVVVVYKMQSNDSILNRLIMNYLSGNEKLHVYVPVVVAVVSLLVTSANSIASSAVTREGSSFEFMKYIPLSLRTQLNIKAAVSIIVSMAGMIVYIIAASVYIGVSLPDCLMYILIAFLGVIFVTYLGITLDSVNPKLLWEDEINALRGNATVFFVMAYSMILGAILLGMAFVLLEFTLLPVWGINCIIMIFMVIVDIVVYVNCVANGSSNLKEL